MATSRTRRPFNLKMNAHRRLPFTVDEYRRRYDHAIALLKAAGLDALLIRSPENICYLTGYETPGYYGYHCLLLARDQQPVLVARRLELTNVPEFSWLVRTAPVADDASPFDVTARTLDKMGLSRGRLGVEKSGWFFTVEEFEGLQQRLPRAQFEDGSMLVEQARMVKSEPEVEMIRRSVDKAEKAFLAGARATRPGVTEDQIAGALHKVWCEAGAEFTGLPNFIVSGRRSGACHATWRGRKLNQNDNCFFEICASTNRYAGVAYRTVTVGKVKPKLRRLANASIGALEAVLAAIKPGVACHTIDRIGHREFVKAGFGKDHVHRIGYSIGVNFPPDWGEGQIISIRKGEQRLLQENMTFHLVPGCLLFDEMGVVLGATVRVTANGCENLNTLPIKLYEQ